MLLAVLLNLLQVQSFFELRQRQQAAGHQADLRPATDVQ